MAKWSKERLALYEQIDQRDKEIERLQALVDFKEALQGFRDLAANPPDPDPRPGATKPVPSAEHAALDIARAKFT